MGHYLLAVLVADFATVADIDIHLLKPMRRLVRAHRVDDYRLGGGVTGAWDPGYDPGKDLANWRPCPPAPQPPSPLTGKPAGSAPTRASPAEPPAPCSPCPSTGRRTPATWCPSHS